MDFYIATDGNCGEAKDLLLVKYDDLSDEEWELFDNLPENSRYSFVEAVINNHGWDKKWIEIQKGLD